MGAFVATPLHSVGPGHQAFGIRGRKGDALTGHRSSSVQSVERAISILRSFGLETPERGVGELGCELGLNKSTVSRLVMTLERAGLLSRNPVSERYRLGVYSWGWRRRSQPISMFVKQRAPFCGVSRKRGRSR